MDSSIMMALAKAGGLAALGVAAIGSAIGSGLAGSATINT